MLDFIKLSVQLTDHLVYNLIQGFQECFTQIVPYNTLTIKVLLCFLELLPAFLYKMCRVGLHIDPGGAIRITVEYFFELSFHCFGFWFIRLLFLFDTAFGFAVAFVVRQCSTSGLLYRVVCVIFGVHVKQRFWWNVPFASHVELFDILHEIVHGLLVVVPAWVRAPDRWVSAHPLVYIKYSLFTTIFIR